MFPRRVILGVTAGIAAYKSCELLRRLQDRGLDITVLPTENSLHFVGAATWEALSGKRVITSLWQDVASGAHVELARDAELILIAPTTADFISRLTQGRSDDLLSATVLTSQSPVVLVPAMHHQMWTNPATQENIKTLRSRGIIVMEPAEGPLNNGDIGVGRFPETFEIIDFLNEMGLLKSDLMGKRCVVTAGGTREMIDPVRFIGNLSSGKQGIALAKEAASRGANVTLIAANIERSLIPQDNRIAVVNVQSADDLFTELSSLTEFDALFMAAAVADYRPAEVSQRKIKRDGSALSLELMENPDLIATFTADYRGRGGQGKIIAFAAESEVELESARRKLIRKGVDYLFINDVLSQKVFNSESNGGTLLSKTGDSWSFEYQSKDTLSGKMLDILSKALG